MQNQQSQLWRAAAIAAILIAGAFAWRAGAQGGAAPVTPAVATINVENLINSLEEKKALQTQLEEYRSKRVARLQEIEQQLQSARSELEVIPPNTEEFYEQVETVERLRVNLQSENEFAQQQIDNRRGRIFQSLFDKIRTTAEQFAKQNGYDLVISDDSGIEVQIGGELQVVRQIASVKLVYAADRLDITSAILQQMNADYRAAQQN